MMDYPNSMVTDLIQGDGKSKWIAHSNHNVKCFTQDEIIRITNNYQTKLGSGSFGEVYEGHIEDKSVVAVKRFVNNVKENFVKELTVHREINHKNVVRLVGYCSNENALMMVMECIPNGNLSDALHRKKIPLPLDTRLRIAIECAEALDYMHSQMYTHVIHGDIKPANILLDDGFGAKISDFGISRLVNTENTSYTSNVIGSIGYMDPMFACTGRLTAKSDVYSFGIVLLELVTRKKAGKDGEIDLIENFKKALAKGIRKVKGMFDSEIAIPSNMKTIEQIARLVVKCLSFEIDKRPEMLEVAEHLRRFRKDLQQRQERRSVFSWGKKNELAPVDTPSQESSSTMKPSDVVEHEYESRDQCESNRHNVRRSRARYNCSSKVRMGNLGLALHGNGVYGLSPLDWKQRVAISLAAARGVACIHSAGPWSCHGNIKSYTIMLTGTHNACLSEPEHGVTLSCASGYRAPEINGNKHVSQKADVYSFGVLLLELLNRKTVVKSKQLEEVVDLPQWARTVIRENRPWEVFDPEILAQQHTEREEECMVRFLELAIDCCSQDAKLRPTMSHVVQRIEEITT